MANKIYPQGTRVKCIDPSGDKLKEGNIYIVKRYYRSHGELYVDLEGVDMDGWLAERFELHEEVKPEGWDIP